MTNNILNLYNELKEKITIDRLKEITIEIISRFKKKDSIFFSQFAKIVGIADEKTKYNKIFGQIIQIYHPDKFSKIQGDLELFFRNKDQNKLIYLKNIYLIDLKAIQKSIDYSYNEEEEHVYEEDFGYQEYDIGEELSDYDFIYNDSEGDEASDEIGFLEAINSLFVGNLDLSLSVSDLKNMEDDLDLSDFQIIDLKGIEHCINIKAMNLSGNYINRIQRLSFLIRLEFLYLSENYIDDISALSSLANLRELDLSYNHIEDFSPLLELDNLKYVNIIHNPPADKTIIEKLTNKGVIIIY